MTDEVTTWNPPSSPVIADTGTNGTALDTITFDDGTAGGTQLTHRE